MTHPPLAAALGAALVAGLAFAAPAQAAMPHPSGAAAPTALAVQYYYVPPQRYYGPPPPPPPPRYYAPRPYGYYRY